MQLRSFLARSILPFAALGCLLLACGGAATSDPTGQSAEDLSSSASTGGGGSSDEGATAVPEEGHCNIVYAGRELYETGLCVIEGKEDNPVCELVEAPQCHLGRRPDVSICACGSLPDCTFRDNVKCSPLPPATK
jgi:hypothetical protein